MTINNQTSSQNAAFNFESALLELEAIVSQMENGNLPLAQSISAYTRGASLLQLCQQSLADAEQQVQLLADNNQLQAFNIGE